MASNTLLRRGVWFPQEDQVHDPPGVGRFALSSESATKPSCDFVDRINRPLLRHLCYNKSPGTLTLFSCLFPLVQEPNPPRPPPSFLSPRFLRLQLSSRYESSAPLLGTAFISRVMRVGAVHLQLLYPSLLVFREPLTQCAQRWTPPHFPVLQHVDFCLVLSSLPPHLFPQHLFFSKGSLHLATAR